MRFEWKTMVYKWAAKPSIQLYSDGCNWGNKSQFIALLNLVNKICKLLTIWLRECYFGGPDASRSIRFASLPQLKQTARIAKNLGYYNYWLVTTVVKDDFLNQEFHIFVWMDARSSESNPFPAVFSLSFGKVAVTSAAALLMVERKVYSGSGPLFFLLHPQIIKSGVSRKISYINFGVQMKFICLLNATCQGNMILPSKASSWLFSPFNFVPGA